MKPTTEVCSEIYLMNIKLGEYKEVNLTSYPDHLYNPTLMIKSSLL